MDGRRRDARKLGDPRVLGRVSRRVGELGELARVVDPAGSLGEAAGGRTLLAIEAKADESFGDYTVERYLEVCARRDAEYPAKVELARRAGKRVPLPSNAAARIEQLCAALFGPAPEGERVAPVAKPLRYQLVTAAGALIRREGASLHAGRPNRA